MNIEFLDAVFIGVVVVAFAAFGWVVATDFIDIMRRRKNDSDN